MIKTIISMSYVEFVSCVRVLILLQNVIWFSAVYDFITKEVKSLKLV